MKYNPFIFSFLILMVLCGSINATDNYIINNNSVYINDSKVFLSATPHTLSSSGWVYFNLISKVYTGNIDVCWGFNTSVSKSTKAELYEPHWINTTADHQKTFYNPSFVVYTGDKLDYGNSYNTNHRYTVTEQIINDNGTIYITSNASFDSFNTDETNYTVYWHTRNDNYYLWKDFTDSFSLVNHDYKGFDKWYYIKNISIISDKEYTVRAWVDIPVSTEKQSGKYYFAIKPSHETISQAITNGHFYNLDPWWDATWFNRKNIMLTGNTSGAQTDYQLLLNVTYDSDMQSDFDDLRFCNETHKLDSWLESKVDSSYALVWVKFPTTPANGVEQMYYMYYGNAGAASNWDYDATFTKTYDDTYEINNLHAGWHCDEGSGTNLTDFSGNGHTGTFKGVGEPAWEGNELTPFSAGDSLHFDGSNDYATFANIATIPISTHIVWINADVIDATTNQAYIHNINTGGTPLILIRVSETGGVNKLKTMVGVAFTEQNINPSTTYCVAIVSNPAGNDFLYINGVEVASKAHSTAHAGDTTRWALGCGRAFGNPFDGIEDEARVYNAILPPEKILCLAEQRKYAADPPTYAFGSEETALYIPPSPINLANTTGNFWVNHIWSAGSGNVTDSYNVSVNDVWHNTSPAYYNDTYSAHAWQNITVWAYNSSGTGTLSSGSISQDTQIPNNAITITNTSDWTGNAGEVVYVDYDATDADSDTATFSCNRMDLFTDFDTTTGKGNWTATANIYYVDFGVSDGYGSTSNYTMTLIESSVEITLLDELKLIMSEITSGLKSINMGNYLVYAFILIGILFIILLIQLLNNCIYRG